MNIVTKNVIKWAYYGKLRTGSNTLFENYSHCGPQPQHSFNSCDLTAKMSGDSVSQHVLVTHRGDDITLEEALEEEQNMLVRLTFLNKFAAFREYLENYRTQIEAAVSHHLNLGRNDRCSLGHMREWIHGSFNMCLPLRITRQASRSQSRVMIRFPLPYKIGEENNPGNADEKLRCEAATYVFIQENCPDIPVPKLLGFAFSGNDCVSHPIHLSRINLFLTEDISLLR